MESYVSQMNRNEIVLKQWSCIYSCVRRALKYGMGSVDPIQEDARMHTETFYGRPLKCTVECAIITAI